MPTPTTRVTKGVEMLRCNYNYTPPEHALSAPRPAPLVPFSVSDALPTLLEHSHSLVAQHTYISSISDGERRAWPFVKTGSLLVSTGMQARLGVELRPFQRRALDQVLVRRNDGSSPLALSGLVKMPCGAGKTLWSLWLAMELQTFTLIVTQSVMASVHWSEQLHKFFEPPSRGVLVLRHDGGDMAATTDRLLDVNGKCRPGIVICTYQALNSPQDTEMESFLALLRALPHGLLVLDDPAIADTVGSVLDIPSFCTLATSATFHREDERMNLLPLRVGPVVANVDRGELLQHGFIAPIRRVEVLVPSCGTDPVRQAPKLLALLGIVRHHALCGQKQLVFCDDFESLKFVFRLLSGTFREQMPVVGPLSQETPGKERLAMLEQFRRKSGAAVFCLLHLADTSVDLVGASVLVQVSCVTASKNQEVQRTGRIQRPSVCAEHVAYTLVARGSVEQSNVLKRRKCMQDEGYYTQVCHLAEIKHVPGPEDPKLVEDALQESGMTACAAEESRPAPKRSCLRERIAQVTRVVIRPEDPNPHRM